MDLTAPIIDPDFHDLMVLVVLSVLALGVFAIATGLVLAIGAACESPDSADGPADKE
ncbi:hypothetical protein [Burkholderia cenocepacia]|uniref:hypothetical protein n=1 Tax=Burkholderia cenocepacia TaxID=95486 RepID=UPI001639F0D2|nr:hypothetical protein [Burkholderia cenocepacia]